MNKKLSITKLYAKAKQYYDKNKLQEADDTLDWCLIILSKNVLSGKNKDTDLLEGVKMGVWYERIWVCSENWGFLPE